MAKVIKAGYARVVEIERPADVKEKPLAVLDEQPDESAVQDMLEDEAPVKSAEAQEADARETYQAAYDELIIAAQDEVAAMLSDARNEALSLMREAENSVNDLRDQAWEEGYSNATAQARAQSDEMIAAINAKAEEMEKNFESECKRILEELETQMLGIAMDVAGKILHKELADDDEAYLSMLREAVSRMPAEDVVTIRLNPEEYNRFFKKKDAKLQTEKGQVDVKLIADPTLNSYDAVIESPSGVIDAGADTQMAQMKRNMGL